MSDKAEKMKLETGNWKLALIFEFRVSSFQFRPSVASIA